jgi:pimeloyl-ACP methyl ester carboxylesterase
VGTRRVGTRSTAERRLCAAALASLLLAACGVPVGVNRVDPRNAYEQHVENALATGEPSENTRTTLRSKGLLARFETDPAGTIDALHQIVTSGRAGRRDVFALAELSLINAEEKKSRPYYFAAAAYAWAFLFPEGVDEPPSRFDDRSRVATEIYNRAIVGAFTSSNGKLDFESGVYALPFGKIEVRVAKDALVWDDRQITDIEPLGDLEVHGLLNVYRRTGLGAPLGARAVLQGDEAADDLVAARVRLPITAVLRFEKARQDLKTGRLQARLEIFTQSDAETVTIDGEDVPLQYEPSAAMARSLQESPLWEHEIWGFFGRAPEGDKFPLLRSATPHRKGTIPVVFVHGTASSPGRWADMLNDLWSQSWVRERYEPWLFMYDTGYPIPYSAMMLREKVQAAVAKIESSQGTDPCLHQIVMIGHSQGGLLVKLAVIDSDDKLWNVVAKRPFATLTLSKKNKELLQKTLFVEPIPEVTRVVFVATPHRGSYQAGGTIAGWVAGFIRMPVQLVTLTKDLVTLNTDAFAGSSLVTGVPTSIQGMNPNNPFLKVLVEIPPAPGVAAHSIIPVLGEGPPDLLNDGVVEYKSAHIDGVASELVVRSGHSTQPLPATIEEVRRILAVHAEAVAASGVHCGR